MKKPRAEPPTAQPDESSDDLQAFLDGFGTLISGQLAAADKGDCDQVLALGTEIEGMLKQAIPLDKASPKAAQQLAQIMAARRKLMLKLALQKKETAEELSRLRRGKAGLHAYRKGIGG